ncbi:peptidase M48 family protein [Coprinopsis marcescibilis]|uniref:Peptidase M48 family protein n=1 Tax=Coprinopsis marcescibilis TaxID=230819 RepID=A0A5C3KGC5_COPMA|nr:peptidase M48 family protein [Coprinopsis marcescibilis]
MFTLIRTLGRLNPAARRPCNLATRIRPFHTTKTTGEIRYVRFQSPRPGGESGKPGPKEVTAEVAPIVKVLGIITLLGGGYYVSHLEQVPMTGRWRFMNTGPKTEAMMGEAIREEIHQTMGHHILPPNHPITIHVRRVVSRILTASNLGVIRGERRPAETLLGVADLFGGYDGFSDVGATTQPNESYGPDKEWEVLVVNDRKMINAMAGPGVVVVFTGILPVCKNEEGLAAVVAHEIGHIVARHPAERLSSQTVWVILGVMLQVLGLDYMLTRGITTYFLDLPNSRTQEHEADLIGLRLMSRACYNPSAAPAMFERLGKIEASSPRFEFAQTHPNSENRVKRLEKELPQAYQILEANPECAQIRRQLDAFRETAHGIRVDETGGWKLV